VGLPGDRRHDRGSNIEESDVRTDTYRASGSGGQRIDKTNFTAIKRLTRAPTGIVVAVQAERSRRENRAKAWDMLRAGSTRWN